MEKAKKFDEQMGRIKLVTGAGTQAALAEYLGIRQSSVSDAKRRGNIPAEWLLTLLRVCNANPEWIATGRGVMYLSPKPGHYEDAATYWEKSEMLATLRRLPSRMLADELVRRTVLAESVSVKD